MMKKSLPNPPQQRRSGFTLIELLVVIAIIVVLAGLMFPAVSGALKKAEKTHAENTCYNLKNAITTYFTEYRKYPVENVSDEDVVVRSDNELMDILLGADSQANGLNPRRIAFYSGKQAKPMGGGKYRKGVRLEADGGGQLWDPFGEFYYVAMDTDYNNRVEKPSWDNTTDSQFLPESVLVWSSGEDGEENEEKDNIKIW